MTRTLRAYAWLGLTIAMAALLSTVNLGCSSMPLPALEQARTAYQEAQQDANVTTHAPVALQQAGEALQRAERVWQEQHDEPEVQHLASLVERKVDIARMLAQQKKSEDDIKLLGDMREQVLREAREKDLQRAEKSGAEAAKRAALLQQQLALLQQKLASLKAPVRETERGLVLTLSDVLFAVDKANLRSGTLRNLYPLVTFLKEQPTRQVSIEGHTDNTGTNPYNLDLSQRRADAVSDFLMHNGIPPTQITTRGYGEAYPVATNDSAAGRQRNRRVEVIIAP